MTALNLLNATTLDQQLLFTIIGLAAVLLAVIIGVVIYSVRARKRRKERSMKKMVTKVIERVTKRSTDEKVPQQTGDVSQPIKVENNQVEEPAVNVTDEIDDEEELPTAELDELSVAQEENAEEVEEAIAVQLADDSNDRADIVYRSIRYNRSFWARLTQSSDEVKQRYSVLKNHLLSYSKVKPALSWRRERFSLGRITYACFVMRGKKLCLCFATDPKRFDGTKYKVVDMSVRSPKSKQPCKYRIISDRRVTYAKEIIDMLMGELSVEKLADYTEQNYVMPYRETDALIEDGLIKVKIIDSEENGDIKIDRVETIKEIVKQSQALPKRDFKILPKVEATEVNVMSDAQAKQIIEYKPTNSPKSAKGKKGIINIDVLSQKFPAGARITIDSLRENSIIPSNVNYIKVLANGILDKPLIVEADDFSLQAVKMIALTGGRVIRTSEK